MELARRGRLWGNGWTEVEVIDAAPEVGQIRRTYPFIDAPTRLFQLH